MLWLLKVLLSTCLFHNQSHPDADDCVSSPAKNSSLRLLKPILGYLLEMTALQPQKQLKLNMLKTKLFTSPSL